MGFYKMLHFTDVLGEFSFFCHGLLSGGQKPSKY